MAVAGATDALDPVLVADFKMPGLNGVQLVRKVRLLGLTFAVLIVTAFPEEHVLQEPSGQGLVFHILTKPWKPEQLLEFVDRSVAEVIFKRQGQVNRLG